MNYLKDKEYFVVGVDIKDPDFKPSAADEFYHLDLSVQWLAYDLVKRCNPDEVYHLAADMGGIGYITRNLARLSHHNAFMDLNLLSALSDSDAKFLYASSACVYPTFLQDEDRWGANTSKEGLHESNAWPAQPEEGYGLEKLFIEKMCEYYWKEDQIDAMVARFHNVYGPQGTYYGGKEKVPAALCRKVAMAKNGDSIEVWGDGSQSRSFIYVDDCVEALYLLMQSDWHSPLNIGTEDAVTIDALAHLIIAISGKDLGIKHVEGPRGVYARNSNNMLSKEVLRWEPKVGLLEGMTKTYQWIASEVSRQGSVVR